MMMKMMTGFNTNKPLLCLGILLVKLAVVMGARTKLLRSTGSGALVKNEADPVKVLLLTEALWYVVFVWYYSSHELVSCCLLMMMILLFL